MRVLKRCQPKAGRFQNRLQGWKKVPGQRLVKQLGTNASCGPVYFPGEAVDNRAPCGFHSFGKQGFWCSGILAASSAQDAGGRGQRGGGEGSEKAGKGAGIVIGLIGDKTHFRFGPSPYGSNSPSAPNDVVFGLKSL